MTPTAGAARDYNRRLEVSEWRRHGRWPDVLRNLQLRLRMPCVTSQMSALPTEGDCKFVMAFQIDHGNYGKLSLDGLGFIVLGVTPGAMINGNWSVGLITDQRASPEQREAITAIASGSAGGPMAALSGLIGKFAGVESAPRGSSHIQPKTSVKE